MSPPSPPGRRDHDGMRQARATAPAPPRPARGRELSLAGAVVRGLSARASVARPPGEIRRARRHAIAGDQAWQERLARYAHGDVVIAELTADVVIERPDDERPRRLACCHETVWLDRQVAQEVIEERLRQIARRDFKTFGDGLRDHHGVALQATIAVDVQLEVDLAAQFARRAPGDPTG